MASLRIRILHRASRNPRHYGKTKPAPVYISLSLKGEKDALVNTGVNVSLSQWDKKRKRVINHAQLATLNKRIADMRYEVETAYKKLSDQEIRITPQSLKGFLINPVDINYSVFYRQEMEKRRPKVAIGTYKSHRQTINALDEYKENVSFETICDPAFILDFIDWLGSSRALKPNSRHKHFKNLKVFINLAERRQHILINDNPIRLLKGAIRTVPTDKIYLTPDELLSFENLVLEGSQQRLRKYLDCFLFGCYTGLRFGDLTSIRQSDIEVTGEGMKLHYKAEKTHKENILPLRKLFPLNGSEFSRPEQILKKITGSSTFRPGQRFFPIDHVQVLNRALKQIAELANPREIIKQRLTSHAARRTCVNMLYVKGADAKLIQAITQHSDERELMKYLDGNAEVIETRLSKINW